MPGGGALLAKAAPELPPWWELPLPNVPNATSGGALLANASNSSSNGGALLAKAPAANVGLQAVLGGPWGPWHVMAPVPPGTDVGTWPGDWTWVTWEDVVHREPLAGHYDVRGEYIRCVDPSQHVPVSDGRNMASTWMCRVCGLQWERENWERLVGAQPMSPFVPMPPPRLCWPKWHAIDPTPTPMP